MSKRSYPQFQNLFQWVTADSFVCGTSALFVMATVLLVIMMQVLARN